MGLAWKVGTCSEVATMSSEVVDQGSVVGWLRMVGEMSC